MELRPLLFGLAAWLGLACAGSSADGPPKFELKDGDRVVLLGGTFIERDQAEGYLETLLTSRFPKANVTFRNLGWSGDTVFGLARARFGKQADGFQHLKEHVEALKPTVLIVSYGQNESFEGEAGLATFRKGLDGLLKVLEGTKARIVFVSPIRHEDLGRPLPDPAKHNANLYLYIDALKKVADEKGFAFVDLFEKLSGPQPLTDNGIHLTPAGYLQAAEVTAAELGVPPLATTIAVEQGGQASVKATPASLPSPRPPVGAPAAFNRTVPKAKLEVKGLQPGTYQVKIDDKAAGTGTVDKGGVLKLEIENDPDLAQVEKLRQTINAKNELYFHRWRPQNETYLFGFRKHEQGNNAREIPLFDPLVSAKEAEIAKLRIPPAHTYQFVRTGETSR